MTLNLHPLPAVSVPDHAAYYPHIAAWLATGAEAMRAVDSLVSSDPRTVAVDTETMGLGADSFTIKCLTAAWETSEGTVSVLLDPSRNNRDKVAAQALLRHAAVIAFHNSAFDVPPMYQNGLLSLGAIDNVVCTAVYGRMAYPEKETPKSLENLSIKLAGFRKAELTMAALFHANGWTLEEGYRKFDIDRPVYRLGAMADTVALLRLLPAVQAECWRLLVQGHPFTERGLDSAGAVAVMEREQRVNRVMLRRSAVGLDVDTDYLESYTETNARKLTEASDLLVQAGLEPGRGDKLVEMLDARGELPADHPRTPTGRLKADKYVMERLSHPLADAHRNVAELEKVTGYLTKVSDMVKVTGKVHPQVAVLGASATGRMSYSMPELQQFPADARPIIVCDTGLTSVDWSQIEPVIMANCAGDRSFLEPFEAGADLYEPIMNAAGIPRKTAKVLLLAAMYGQGRESVARGLGITEDQAQTIQAGMFSAMPVTKAFMDRIRDIGTQYGMIPTADGRILRIPTDPKTGKRMGYKGVNYFCQGSAYSVLADTIVRLDSAGLSSAIHLAMHDELVVDTSAAEAVAEIMRTPPEFMLKWTGGRPPVFKTDTNQLGKAWAYV